MSDFPVTVFHNPACGTSRRGRSVSSSVSSRKIAPTNSRTLLTKNIPTTTAATETTSQAVRWVDRKRRKASRATRPSRIAGTWW